MKKVIFLAIGCWLLAVSCSDKKGQDIKAPIRVKTEVVSTAMNMGGQTYVGMVEEREVSRGQLIAVMDDTQARNLLSGAEAQMAQANDALARYKMLYDNGSLPEVQWVEIQSKVAQAKSQLEVA